MARIVIASASQAGGSQISRLLASSGYGVFRVCASGSELRRALNACEDGIVIILGSVPNCLPDDLTADFDGRFQILLIGRPDVLSGCESARVFKLGFPCAGTAVLGAVEMLSQLHAMRLPKRTGAEKALIEQAKALLMRKDGIAETEAHRRMQQYAMQHGIRMTDYALALLQSSEGTEE